MAGDEVRGLRPVTALTELLGALCGPYADPALPAGCAACRQRLAGGPCGTCPRISPAARLNLVQPPMAWLVEQAGVMHGRLLGSLTAGRGLVVLDGIQVEAAHARALAERTAAAFPATDDVLSGYRFGGPVPRKM